ncbi:MAG: pectate lyase [Candidatus Didemnitutus sp.]|nr:pectate lyase [Candidatus Didemnitutus sp.]
MHLRALALCLVLVAPLGAVESVKWSERLPRDAQWFTGAQGRAIAENLLLYQYPSGGWPKNIDMAKPLSPAEKAELEERAHDDATMDNGATTTQIKFLARAYAATQEPRYRAAAERGLDYLLAAQYPNGGWPQYFPLRKGYYTHITFNDDAMVKVLEVLKAVGEGSEPFAWIDVARREKARASVARGVACILQCQVVQNGTLTAWGAQHDETTLAPTWARKFEPPSLASRESATIVSFLMSLPQPSSEIVRAVDAAVAWFEKVPVHGIRWTERPVAGGMERFAEKDPAASPTWARFYELGTDRPVFMGRDSVVHYDVNEIELERRNGYGWYSDQPKSVLKAYKLWKAKLKS